MQKARLKRLLRLYFNNSISNDDCIELLEYLNSSNPDDINEFIDAELTSLNEGPEFKGEQSLDVLNRIKADPRFNAVIEEQDEKEPRVVRFYQRRWVQVAAAVLIICGAAGVLFKNRLIKTADNTTQIAKATPIVPGGNKAILTVAGGKTIVLDSAANGTIAQTDAGKVVKTNSGQIVYNADNASHQGAEIAYNTLSTPKGGEYQVVLPDGTKVWLDAASSIVYPTAFAGNERRVELTGQAYFEVAKNKKKPFYVDVNQTQIRVLGTHFNISAYNDDRETTTTLLEGSVQISKNNSISLLKPGQQAVINNGSDKIVVGEANIQDAMAWKEGYFIFNDDNISGIMRKVSRWYDVTVDYRGNYDDQQFGGTFYRSKSIAELLQHLERVGKVHFKISGRRVTVMD